MPSGFLQTPAKNVAIGSDFPGTNPLVKNDAEHALRFLRLMHVTSLHYHAISYPKTV
jgi:hypothetical protein